MRGLRTAPVICLRSVWRLGPAGQHKFSDRLVSHRLGLCLLSLYLFAAQVWGRWGLQVWMVFFQTCNRTHSDHLPVVDSPECWGMVSCNWWCLSFLSTLKHSHWKIICSLAYQNNSSLPLWSPFPMCILYLFIQDFIPFSVSIYFGLTELSEFSSEPRFVVVVG